MGKILQWLFLPELFLLKTIFSLTKDIINDVKELKAKMNES